MKRSITFALILVVLVALPFSASWSKHTWTTVGQNPTTTSIVATLKKMDVSPEVIDFVKLSFPESTYVEKGMVFNEGLQGAGLIQKNVFIEFDSAKALVWRTGNVDVAFILECNNVVWAPAGVIPTVPEPIADSSSFVSPLPITTGADSEGLSAVELNTFLLWIALLLIILLALWTLWLWIQQNGSRFGIGRSKGDTTPTPTQPDPESGDTATETPPVSDTPTIPHVPPVDKFAELKETAVRYLELKAELEDTRKKVLKLSKNLLDQNQRDKQKIATIMNLFEG